KNRIAMISRQSRTLSLDMQLLKEEIERQNPNVEVVTLNRVIPPGILGKIGYLWYMITTEMHMLATSRVVILEGYCINASVLHHREELRIVQMWHALGVLKQFGYLAVGTEEGHSEKLARAMHMHENYDDVICSSEFCRPFYAAAFHFPVEKVKVCPLPRTDLLQDKEYRDETRERILERYPALGNGKKNILYAPTFRKGTDITEPLDALFDAFNFDEYNLIVKLHPVDRTAVQREEVFQCPEFKSMELFSVADAMITDYSSIMYEAAVAGIPVYLYTYDLEEYLDRRGFIIDFEKDIPLKKYGHPEELMADVETAFSDTSNSLSGSQRDFIRKYVEPGRGNTSRLATFILHREKSES
ncbi:MAG: CDP-glycerol glycerophosphotransferase family protein, partial [bacterium]|nr:CDP-glycerol glycerophosphotransferase family protein [bacterium]